MKHPEITQSLFERPAPPGTWLLRWKSGSLASLCVQPKPNFQASPGDQILKLVDHYLLRSYGERDIRLLKHRSQRRDIEALGKCTTVGFLHFVLDFCKESVSQKLCRSSNMKLTGALQDQALTSTRYPT